MRVEDISMSLRLAAFAAGSRRAIASISFYTMGFFMSWQFQAHHVPREWQHMRSVLGRLGKLAIVPLVTGIAQGCAAIPISPFIGPDPSDPLVHTAAVSYRSTIGSYLSQRPVEPLPWKEQSKEAAPSHGSEHKSGSEHE